MVAITAETEGCGKVDGAESYSLGSEVTLTAVAERRVGDDDGDRL